MVASNGRVHEEMLRVLGAAGEVRQIADCRLTIPSLTERRGERRKRYGVVTLAAMLQLVSFVGDEKWGIRNSRRRKRHFANSFETTEQQPKQYCGSRFNIDNYLVRNFAVNKASVATLSTFIARNVA